MKNLGFLDQDQCLLSFYSHIPNDMKICDKNPLLVFSSKIEQNDLIDLEINISASKALKEKDYVNDTKDNKMRVSNKSCKVKIKKQLILDNKLLVNLITEDKDGYKIVFNRSNFCFEMKNLLDCIEFLFDSEYDIKIGKSNIIYYLNAFTVFNITKMQLDVVEQLFNSLNNENSVLFIKFIENISENSIVRENCSSLLDFFSLDKFIAHCYWLVQYLVIKAFGIKIYNENLLLIEEDFIKKEGKLKKSYSDIVKIKGSNIEFKQNGISYKKTIKEINLEEASKGFCYEFEDYSSIYCNLKFLNSYHKSFIQKSQYFYKENNYFNTGKVIRRKSEEGLIHDYPHFFQLILDNDPNLQLFAVRETENGNFLLSKSIDNFNKFSSDYIGEIEANFWGTQFDIYDNGVEKTLFDKLNPLVFSERKLLGKIVYETNIMGEMPRYFISELYLSGQKYELKNLEPEWNTRLNCYCLNFYGRVKKASARNFQMIFPGEVDDILLQHGKENSDEFNIDFREPFNYVTAFAHSLVSIGRKRIVS